MSHTDDTQISEEIREAGIPYVTRTGQARLRQETRVSSYHGGRAGRSMRDMRRLVRVCSLALTFAFILLACGSRTGLFVDVSVKEPADATVDPGIDVDTPQGPDATLVDAPGDGPLFDRVTLDVKTDCPDPEYCDERDPGFIYKCGQRVVQCSSIEQCSQAGDAGVDSGAARCANPCLDTLGQDTSNGCEFYAVEMDANTDTAGVCYAVFIVNQWKTGEPARIQVERAGTVLPIDQFARIPVGSGPSLSYAPYSSAQGLAKDQVAILFLSRDPAAATRGQPTDPARLANCPAGVVPAVVGDAAIHGTGRGQAFRIKTNVPVVAYQMMPYGGGRARVTGATLLPPTNVWDTNYVVTNGFRPSTIVPNSEGAIAIIAQETPTRLTIRPNADVVGGGGVPAVSAGQLLTYTLNRGEYLQIVQRQEISGSPLESDKPVAVYGGMTYLNVPVNRRRADHAEQMLPPIRALGSEYVAVRYRSRDPNGEEVVPWRFIGVVNNTQLTYLPSAPSGAPTTLQAGQVVEFDSPGYFVVSSDASHPFYMSQYMTGGEPFDGEGDAEWVNVIPPGQFLPRYTFFTDPTYPETNLVVVRSRASTSDAFPDVRLDCAGILGGWQPLGTRYQYTRVSLSTGNFEAQGRCNNGVHTMETVTPDGAPLLGGIGVTIWGWGNPITYPPTNDETHPLFTRWVSYAYPAGANFRPLNNVLFSTGN